jgi:quinol monooxygenase YgiN
MATILAHITVQDGKEKEFEEVLHRLWRSTHEHEDHVLRYEYWRGAEKNQYYGLLSFNDYNGFLEHQTSDHHETDAKLLTHLFTDFRTTRCRGAADGRAVVGKRLVHPAQPGLRIGRNRQLRRNLSSREALVRSSGRRIRWHGIATRWRRVLPAN